MLDRNHQSESLSYDELCQLSDELVMEHLERGHGDALGVVFDRYHRLVLSVGLKILHDVGEAEDVMQTVFMEIFQSAAQFDAERGTLKKWILRRSYHRAINRRRQLLVRQFYANEDLAEVEELLPTLGHDILASTEARDLVEQGFQALTEAQRRVIELACFEGLSMKEIAETTGDPIGNVRHSYYRGLGRLRDFLESDQKKEVIRGRRKEMSDAEA